MVISVKLPPVAVSGLSGPYEAMEHFITEYFQFVTIPLVLGFMLDFVLGDPLSAHHPVVLIGKLISLCDRVLRKGGKKDFAAGIVTAAVVSLISALLPCLLLYAVLQCFGRFACMFVSSLLCWQMLAARDLVKESGRVYEALQREDLPEARRAVSMIVGRDTDALNRDGVIRAAVETVAENTPDGVTAPAFFMALLGIPGLYFYKAVSTMDSMIGYKNEKYLLFGRAAARLDDVLNFIPARISAFLMILAAALLPGLDGREAAAVFLRDHRKSSSPNAACTESVAAGALRLRLLGPASYFGKMVEKPFIGNDDRQPEPEDIRRACRLMYLTSFLMLLILTVPAGAIMLFVV